MYKYLKGEYETFGEDKLLILNNRGFHQMIDRADLDANQYLGLITDKINNAVEITQSNDKYIIKISDNCVKDPGYSFRKVVRDMKLGQNWYAELVFGNN